MIDGINHITLSANNIDESLAFYQSLGFKPHVKWDKGAYLSAGDLWFCLIKGHAKPSQDYSHVAFNVKKEQFATIQAQIEKQQIPLWQQNSSQGDSVYFLDPSGHRLEAHSGSLKERLSSLKDKPYAGMVWLP